MTLFLQVLDPLPCLCNITKACINLNTSKLPINFVTWHFLKKPSPHVIFSDISANPPPPHLSVMYNLNGPLHLYKFTFFSFFWVRHPKRVSNCFIMYKGENSYFFKVCLFTSLEAAVRDHFCTERKWQRYPNDNNKRLQST